MSGERGNVPEGWREVKLSDVVTLNYGKSQKDAPKGDDYPIYGTAGIVGRTSGKLSEGPSVIVGRKGTIDKPLLETGPFWAIDTTFYSSWHKDLVPYFLLSFLQNRNLAELNESSGVPSLGRDNLYALTILLPPLPEQRRIAALLSTWDDSLTTLAKLLEAKRQQKRGLAEALLTGKKRLKGFVGEWEEVKLNQLSQRTKGKIVPTNMTGLGIPYIGAKSFNGNFEGFTESSEAVICKADDVLILWDGEYAGNSTTGLEGAVSSTVARLRLSPLLNAVFLQAQLQKDIQLIRDSRTGSGIPHMPSDFEKWYGFSLPPLPEQQAIAAILSTLDAEMASLEALRGKVQQQKRGLMDELLTGRIRVKVGDDA